MRLTGEEHEACDRLVLQMYLAGVAHRDFGRKVSPSADRCDNLTDDAVEAYPSPMESLLASTFQLRQLSYTADEG